VLYDNNYLYPVYSNYAYFDDKKSDVPLQACRIGDGLE
jgi:hypothetical protein